MHTSAQMPGPDTALARAQRRGRRVGIAIFGLIVTGATATWTYQILSVVFAPPVTIIASNCRTGAKGLLRAVQRAHVAAATEEGERAALGRFRAALEPEWGARASLDALCRPDPQALATLGEIDALRYAEEHAVRYEAVGLAPQRRRVQTLSETLFASDGLSGPALP